MRYPVESFTPEEEAILRPHFTNLDRPVFCLVNLPETVKGAMFARYSRYAGDGAAAVPRRVRRRGPEGDRPFDGVEGERAAGLYERVFIGYGDDSIGQVGGAHLACEWVSNILTKVLQRGRLAAYLEQSTRYIPYDQPMAEGGGYRYYRDAASSASPTGRRWTSCSGSTPAASSRFRRGRRSAGRGARSQRRAWRRSIRAKALDLLRGVLPASTLSHVGIFASGQAYEQLLLRLMASPLPEAREFGDMILTELTKVIPSFVARIERPDRGGEWIAYLRERRRATERAVARLGLDRPTESEAPSVELVGVEGGEEDLLAASLFEAAGASEAEIRDRVEALDPLERAELIGELAGERQNRRHRRAEAGRRCATGSRSSPTTVASATSSATAC